MRKQSFEEKTREVKRNRLVKDFEDYGFTVVQTNGYWYDIIKDNIAFNIVDQNNRFFVHKVRVPRDGKIDWFEHSPSTTIQLDGYQCQSREALIEKMLKEIY